MHLRITRPVTLIWERPGKSRTHNDGSFRASDFRTRFDDPLADALVGPVMVIRVAMLAKGSTQGSFADEPEVVGAFPLDAAIHAFGVDVHVGAPGIDRIAVTLPSASMLSSPVRLKRHRCRG